MISEALKVTLAVIDALEEIGVRYHLGGAFASSIHGVPRQTRGVDLVADLRAKHVTALVGRLADTFYVDGGMIREAISRHSSFNLVHFESGFKVDIFVLGEGPFDLEEFGRSKPARLVQEPPRDVFVKSPEDTVLRKLTWYRLGGQVSERQWLDVLGILKLQAEGLDKEYLSRWAADLGVADLLEQATRQAS